MNIMVLYPIYIPYDLTIFPWFIDDIFHENIDILTIFPSISLWMIYYLYAIFYIPFTSHLHPKVSYPHGLSPHGSYHLPRPTKPAAPHPGWHSVSPVIGIWDMSAVGRKTGWIHRNIPTGWNEMWVIYGWYTTNTTNTTTYIYIYMSLICIYIYH